LFQAVQDDVGVGDALEPGEPVLHGFTVGRAPGRRGDALGPALGVLVFLLGEAQQDVPAHRIVLAVREVFVGRGRFDFAPPHHLDGGQVGLVDHQPINRSNITMVPMPAAISTT
jgi:hypothetical protein